MPITVLGDEPKSYFKKYYFLKFAEYAALEAKILIENVCSWEVEDPDLLSTILINTLFVSENRFEIKSSTSCKVTGIGNNIVLKLIISDNEINNETVFCGF
ncbi:hypothetical protein [Pseudemcibacter aquimaris]|uniref:hypothetical protein n=1 Tax=Pseudemcibacter aquimaris TaxID=2857064 RepID=UPI002013671B|nr:hypothetical protein [Pseudemcibacter aquimaris]MCC3860512.1 hypothetical protein [Pseudemcibacter aquimaris]WDU59337.1 hypothetical protein KW060_03545 [Pseudemcibacter aquimaris]